MLRFEINESTYSFFLNQKAGFIPNGICPVANIAWCFHLSKEKTCNSTPYKNYPVICFHIGIHQLSLWNSVIILSHICLVCNSFEGNNRTRFNQGVAPSSRRERRSSAPHLICSSPLSFLHQTKNPHQKVWVLFGGDNRTRTCDLMRVKHAL